MSAFKGKLLEIDVFGESHSERIGATVKNMPETHITKEELGGVLARRRASSGVFSTARKEDDVPVFDKPFDGTIGGDFSFYILNKDVKSSDYNELYGKPRPSHADYCRYLKDGALDFTGGGRFSGRLTAPFCVVGGICKKRLSDKGVKICAYVSQTGNVFGRNYKTSDLSYEEIVRLRDNGYPSLDKKEEMLAEIVGAKSERDSVGGRIDCMIFGLPTGIGDSLFEGLEGKLSSLLFAVPAVKGVEFGSGFDLCGMRGGKANDELYYKDGKVGFYSNAAGGINGGITNGAPVTVSVAVRPTPSVGRLQRTVDLVRKENCEIEIKGRHDACIVPRAVPCIESAVAIALTDEGV